MTKADESKRLEEARILAGPLADRMMAAYVVGGRPGEAEVRALCAAVLLLEARGMPLPPFTEDVIARLTADDVARVATSAPAPVPAPGRRPGLLGHAFRSLRTLRLQRATLSSLSPDCALSLSTLPATNPQKSVGRWAEFEGSPKSDTPAVHRQMENRQTL